MGLRTGGSQYSAGLHRRNHANGNTFRPTWKNLKKHCLPGARSLPLHTPVMQLGEDTDGT